MYINIETDEKTDSMYIRVSDRRIEYTKEVTPDVLIDFDSYGCPVGFDLQNVSLYQTINNESAADKVTPQILNKDICDSHDCNLINGIVTCIKCGKKWPQWKSINSVPLDAKGINLDAKEGKIS